MHGELAMAVIGGNTEGNFGTDATNFVGVSIPVPHVSPDTPQAGRGRGGGRGYPKSRGWGVWKALSPLAEAHPWTHQS